MLTAWDCSKRLWSIALHCRVGSLVGFLIRFEVIKSVIVVSKHFWLSFRVYQSDKKLLGASHGCWVKNVMFWTVLTLFNCVIKVWFVSSAIKTAFSITCKRSVSWAYFPGVRIIIFNSLFLFLKWGQCLSLTDESSVRISKIN